MPPLTTKMRVKPGVPLSPCAGNAASSVPGAGAYAGTWRGGRSRPSGMKPVNRSVVDGGTFSAPRRAAGALAREGGMQAPVQKPAQLPQAG